MKINQIIRADFFELQELLSDYMTLLKHAFQLSSYQTLSEDCTQRFLLTALYSFAVCPVSMKQYFVETEFDVFKNISNFMLGNRLEPVPFEEEFDLNSRRCISAIVFLDVIEYAIDSGCLDMLTAFPTEEVCIIGSDANKDLSYLTGSLLSGLYKSYKIPKEFISVNYREAFVELQNNRELFLDIFEIKTFLVMYARWQCERQLNLDNTVMFG